MRARPRSTLLLARDRLRNRGRARVSRRTLAGRSQSRTSPSARFSSRAARSHGTRRPESRAGLLMWLAGFTWFLGTAFEPALYLHRGPLVHLLLAYPSGRSPNRLARVVVAVAYVDAAIEPLARNDWLSLALAAAVAAAASHTFRGRRAQAARRPRSASGRLLSTPGRSRSPPRSSGGRRPARGRGPRDLRDRDRVHGRVLAVELMRGPGRTPSSRASSSTSALRRGGTLRGKLARALGDPSLVVGYRLPETESSWTIRAAGRAAAARLGEDGDADRRPRRAARGARPRRGAPRRPAARRVRRRRGAARGRERASAGRGAGARRELEASRRRIVEAADAQRRRLEEELRRGAEHAPRERRRPARRGTRRLAAADGDSIATLETELDDARRELREFAHGVHPAVLDRAAG